MIGAHTQNQPRGIGEGKETVLAGVILSAIMAGSFSLAISILSGHPPLVSLLIYSLSGSCGILAFVWQAMLAENRLS